MNTDAIIVPPRMIMLVLLAALSTLSLNLFLPSLTNIAQDLQADYALVSLSIAGYLAVTAVLQLVIGPMSDRFGRRPVLLCGLSCFVVGSLGCLLADDIYYFLLFRALQAGVISGWVLSMAMIRDTHSEREAASLIGYVAMSMAIAPMLINSCSQECLSESRLTHFQPVIIGLIRISRKAGPGTRASVVTSPNQIRV